MLLFEFFPAVVMLVSAIVGVWLYASHRNAPDDREERERRARERAAREALRKSNPGRDPNSRRPSMTA